MEPEKIKNYLQLQGILWRGCLGRSYIYLFILLLFFLILFLNFT